MAYFEVICHVAPIVNCDTRIVILERLTVGSNLYHRAQPKVGLSERAMQTRTLIVDDEPLARQRLSTLLHHEPDFEVIGECAEGIAAVQAILELNPDLVFLDVQMPRMSGFEVLEAVSGKRSPDVVFVTADQRGREASDAKALDYLLKPFCRERFQESLQRVRDAASKRGAPALPNSSRTGADRMVVKSGDRLLFLAFEEVDFIRASANYVRLHVGHTVYAVRETIAAMEANLPADRFVRIHRSCIVNLSALRELYHAGGGEYIATLRSGRQLPVGPTYPPVIRRALSAAGMPRFGSIGGI
jgi:two-component system, LytTR family, response regulator